MLVKQRGARRGAPCVLFWPPLDLDADELAALEGSTHLGVAERRGVLSMLQTIFSDLAAQLVALLQRALRVLEVPDAVSQSYTTYVKTAFTIRPIRSSSSLHDGGRDGSGGGGGGVVHGVMKQAHLVRLVLQEGMETFWLVCDDDSGRFEWWWFSGG